MRYKIYSVKYPGIPPKEIHNKLYLYYWYISFNHVSPEEKIIIKDFHYNKEEHCLNAPSHRTCTKSKLSGVAYARIDKTNKVYSFHGQITNLNGPAKILFNRRDENDDLKLVYEQYFINGEFFDKEEDWISEVEKYNANLWKNTII